MAGEFGGAHLEKDLLRAPLAEQYVKLNQYVHNTTSQFSDL